MVQTAVGLTVFFIDIDDFCRVEKVPLLPNFYIIMLCLFRYFYFYLSLLCNMSNYTGIVFNACASLLLSRTIFEALKGILSFF